jgi:Protein of unknown function (DUF2950)
MLCAHSNDQAFMTAPRNRAVSTRKIFAALLAFSVALLNVPALAADAPAHATKPAQKLFASPQNAGKALYEAAKSSDANALYAVLGPGSGKVINSGDAAEDARGRARLATAYETAARIEMQGDAKALLLLGDHDWPFPFPIVKTGERWRFDVKAGRDEVLARRIGRNELGAMQGVLAYVDAQREYAQRLADGKQLPAYAQRFLSTTGQHEGLYWPTGEGEPQSPMGPLFAAAAGEEAPGMLAAPYHGYYYRILRAQGPHARGGAVDYVVKGRMIGGFALVAYPVRYRASGVKTFLVDHEGVVYSKDLGAQTVSIARAMQRFDPDASWQRETVEQLGSH